MNLIANLICIFILFSLTLTSAHYGSFASSLLPPNLTVGYAGPKWQGGDIPGVLYSPLGDDLDLNCEAPYPIQWNFTGFINPREVVKIQPPRRDLGKNQFILSIKIFFIEAEDYSGLGASWLVSCQKVGDLEMSKSFSIFVTGNNPNSVLVTPKQLTVTDSTLIPCPTKNPTLKPLLYRRNSNGQDEPIRVPSLKYEPTQGFLYSPAQIFSPGVYTCRLTSPSNPVTITASTTSGSSSAYHFSPDSSTIRVFTDSSIHLQCLSKATPPQPIYLTINNAGKNLSIFYSPSNYGQMATIMLDPNFTPSPNETLKSKAVCWIGTQQRPTLLKEWNLEFLPTPTLYLDNFEGEVDCLSDLPGPKLMQTIRCKNPLDCHLMSDCLDNVTFCNFKKQKQFFAEKETNCWVEKLDTGKTCVSVPYSHLNGLAKCTVSGLTKTWEYFVSLDFLKYGSWREAPENELVRLDEVPRILYTNGTTQFTCVAVAFLFADSLSFQLEFQNGTKTLLENGALGGNVNVSNPEIENPRKIDEFNVIGVLDIRLPLEATGINCLAPWWNATDRLETGRKFETRHLLVPKIKDGVKEAGIKKETFYTGEKNRRLACIAVGEPQPEYEWYFKDKNVTGDPNLKMSFGAGGEGYLEFPEVGYAEKKLKGEWRCVAKNRVGKVERRFELDVRDEPISGKTWGYNVGVVVILLILAFVLAMLFIFMRRYKQAKELVRSLTDNEIDEFFQGKPELLEKAEGGNVEIVDFLPYKNEYEIPLDDLEFDSSERNVLGSGEFSYVVRGKIISKQKPVAVKISKPSADVTLFKSLLSEVKIMIYIGKHENVVALIGVCTQGIRNRNIHIATDICDLGSLDVYLRKCRSSFVNLINANQEIDCGLLPYGNAESVPSVNTLDLISFCGQIATGMEYLASKSIIHADLAARNVLLTGNKICKISDFGLSKKLYESNNYVKKSKTPLPWRWMAIESLTTLTFSTSSDIWAYGVTLFEIFTLGDIPFPNEEWNKEFLNRLASGMRMGRPKYSTQEIYSKVVACWESEPELRPSFTQLRTYFQNLLSQYPYDSPVNLTPPSTTSTPHFIANPNFKPSNPPPSSQYTEMEQPESLYMNVDATTPTKEKDATENNPVPDNPTTTTSTEDKPLYVNF